MMKSIVVLIALIGLTVASRAESPAPSGWFLAGSDPGHYTTGTTETGARAGSRAGFLRSVSPEKKEGFGTLMQSAGAGKYLGKRVRMTGQVKADGVEGWAGLWLRIDGEGDKTLSFDNMQERPIQGTSDWKSYQIVLDVPQDSVSLNFGILLDGPGSVLIDDLVFEEVDLSVPTTGSKSDLADAAPANLDFETP